jgi:Leu/Phe-tRNA-protein transferase
LNIFEEEASHGFDRDDVGDKIIGGRNGVVSARQSYIREQHFNLAYFHKRNAILLTIAMPRSIEADNANLLDAQILERRIEHLGDASRKFMCVMEMPFPKYER